MEYFQEVFFADWLEHIFVPEVLSPSQVTRGILEAFIMVNFFTVHLIVELFKNNIELLIVYPRDIESCTFRTP